MKTFAIFFLVFLTISCKETPAKEKLIYYPDGNLHYKSFYDNKLHAYRELEYYQSGELKTASYINKNDHDKKLLYNKKGILLIEYVNLDSLHAVQKTFYENRKMESYGVLYKGKMNGWWNYYDRNGNLTDRRELLTINGVETLNQHIFYNSLHKIDKVKSDFFRLVMKDTLKLGRSVGSIEYTPVLSKKSRFNIYVGENIKFDYSNIKQVKIDTFSTGNKKDIWFGVDFKTPGKKNIRGILEELYYEANKEYTRLDIKKRYVYFHKEVYVK